MAEPIRDLSRARILISNDDGIGAPGIKLLEKVARTLSKDVWVVAPDGEQSAVAHSLTLRRPLRIKKLSKQKYSVDGTPTDSVLLGIQEVLKDKKPDCFCPASISAATWPMTSPIQARSQRPWKARCWVCPRSPSRS